MWWTGAVGAGMLEAGVRGERARRVGADPALVPHPIEDWTAVERADAEIERLVEATEGES